jgi:hypothetical protein
MVLMIRCMLVLFLLTAIAAAEQPAKGPEKQWRVVGRLEHRAIAECSGIVASRRHAGVYWVHNDSGNPAAIYAVKQDGTLVGEFLVAATNEDWEDIAIDERGQLYIGDIGNNGSKRKQLVVYRVEEPEPTRAKDVVPVKVTRKWVLAFPATGGFDCEAMFVHGGYGYLISKTYFGGQAGVYRFSLEEAEGPVVLEKVASVPVRTPVTGADISGDGKRLAVLSVAGVNVFEIEGEVANVANANAVFVPYVHATMEACCFAEGGVLVATEPREMVMFDVGSSDGSKRTGKE